MDGRKIICISREHGSGGREVAEGLASRLGIPCYDKKLLEKEMKEAAKNLDFERAAEIRDLLEKLSNKKQH